MWQLIITGIIVAVAAGIVLYRAVRFFRNPLSKCSGCSMNCGGCALEDLKKEVEKKKNVNGMRHTSFITTRTRRHGEVAS